MKSTALAVSVLCSMTSSAAYALDWSIDTTQSETTELNSNQFLQSSPAASLGSYSTLAATAEGRTPTSKLIFDGDGNYKKYWGPGAEGQSTEYLNYGFRAHYEQNEKTSFDREFAEASWRQQSTALALLNTLGVATSAGGFIDTLTTAGGIDRSVTSVDKLSLFATSTSTSYEPSSGGLAFTDTLANGSWRHQLSSLETVSGSSEAELLDYSNAFNTNVTILRDKLGIDATLSPLLSFRMNAGVAYIQTERGVGSAGLPVSGAASDWIGDATLTYRMLKNTTLTLTANQSTGPSIVGSLFKTDSLGLDLSQTVNADSTLTFSASETRQIATTSTDYASASLTYSRTLTREWSAQLSYRYLHRFASDGTTILDPTTGTPTVAGLGPADSSSITLVVSHRFTALPHGN